MNVQLEIKDKAGKSDRLKVAPFRSEIRKPNPHRHNNYFEIVYLKNGSGTHTIDGHEYPIAPPVVYFIRKEQVHFWDIKSRPTGYVLIIKTAFIETCLDREIMKQLSQISALQHVRPLHNKPVETLFELLNTESREPTKNEPILEGLLKALLGKLLQSEKPVLPIKLGLSPYQRFTDLLAAETRPSNRVAHYARLLNTTPQNLNAICRKEVGKAASEVISKFIINEAKRLLLYTGMSISEISFALGFLDNSHFTRYFKRHVGRTPGTFRTLSK